MLLPLLLLLPQISDSIAKSLIRSGVRVELDEEGNGVMSKMEVPKVDELSHKAIVINERGGTHSDSGSSSLMMLRNRAETNAGPLKCGGIVKAEGGGVSWTTPIIMKEGQEIGQGKTAADRAYKFVNLPRYLIGGHYVRPQMGVPTSSIGQDWTWKLTFNTPVKLYVFVWSGGTSRTPDGRVLSDLNAQLDNSVETNGWTVEPSPGFHRSDNEKHTFKVWSKEFTDHNTEEISGLQGELLAGVVSSACGAVQSCSGGGVEWNAPVVLGEGQATNPGENEFRLQNVPPAMIGGRYIGSKGVPKGEKWAWTIKYEPPVKLFIWVWATKANYEPFEKEFTNEHKFNAGINDAVRLAGWESEYADAFHRSDKPEYKLEVWSKVFMEGSETVIQNLHGDMVGGVVSTAVPEGHNAENAEESNEPAGNIEDVPPPPLSLSTQAQRQLLESEHLRPL